MKEGGTILFTRKLVEKRRKSHLQMLHALARNDGTLIEPEAVVSGEEMDGLI